MLRESSLEAYLRGLAIFQGKLNMMANSIALLLETIIENLELPKRRHISQMVSTLEDNIKRLPQECVDDYQALFGQIKEFNRVWNIAKHGMPVGGRRVFTIHKDGKLYEFPPDRVKEIESGFTDIMAALTRVVNETNRLT